MCLFLWRGYNTKQNACNAILKAFHSSSNVVVFCVPFMKNAHWEEGDMDKDHIAKLIRRRLNLEDQEWSLIENNPKFQQLFQNAIEASKYRLIAEVIESKGCNSGILSVKNSCLIVPAISSHKRTLIVSAPF